ncbi:unnamed protein product [Tenebrio molitor]|nr:unnamed protein product [Tenebrio molitor]
MALFFLYGSVESRLVGDLHTLNCHLSTYTFYIRRTRHSKTTVVALLCLPRLRT